MTTRAAILALLLLLWGGTLWHLDRYPPVHEDEPWILSPGYKLATQGVYGSDLFTGFYRAEEHLLWHQPLMGLLQAPGVRAFGVSVFSMRFLPASFGMLTLALAFACARNAHGVRVGMLAALLLLGWQWAAPGAAPFVSGVPLADLARIARYDLLVAPLALGALWCWMRARRTPTGPTNDAARWDAAAGALGGLAGLAHLYGLFFLLALAVAHALAAARGNGTRSSPFGIIGAGALIVWLPWLALIAVHWDDFTAQTYQHAERFAVADPAFYVTNVLTEPTRYRAGFSSGAAWTRAGFWLLWLGAPLALLALARQVWHSRAVGSIALCATTAVIPLLYALLLVQKTYNYVAPLAPLFAWLAAWALAQLWASRLRWTRALIAAALALVLLEGAGGWLRLHAAANPLPPPMVFHGALRAAIPSGARVLGAPRFWLPLTDYEYRSFALPFMMSSPRINREVISLEHALDQIDPHVVIIDKDMEALLSDRTSPEAVARALEFTTYMQRRGARLVATLHEPDVAPAGPLTVTGQGSTLGAPVRLYALEPQ